MISSIAIVAVLIPHQLHHYLYHRLYRGLPFQNDGLLRFQ